MKLSDAIYFARKEIRDDDSTNGYRFSRMDFEEYYRDAVMEIFRKRPDIRMDENYEMRTFLDPYRYDQSKYVLDGYGDVFGWDKEAIPVLYFEADALNSLIAYSDALYADDQFEVAWTSLGDYARIVNMHATYTYGGLIVPMVNNALANDFTVTAVEIDIPIARFVEKALVYYLCYAALSRDNADTYNAQRSTDFFAKFAAELGLTNG